MAKFIVPSYWLENKGSFSDIKITKAPAGLSKVRFHGTYNRQYVLATYKGDDYPSNIKVPVLSVYAARNWHKPHYEPGRKYFIFHGCYVKKDALYNVGTATVLLSNLTRGMESFIFEQPVRNNDTVYIMYNFTNKMAYEYDYNGNELTHYNIYLDKNDLLLVGGWNDKDRWLPETLYFWNILIWNIFNPLIECPTFGVITMPVASVISLEKNSSAKILLGNAQYKFNMPKFLIFRPNDSTIHKVKSDGTFEDITLSVDINDYSSFITNANDFQDYFKVSDTEWQNLLGSDNKYLIFINNDIPPRFILRYESLELNSGEFIFIRYDYNKPLIIKEPI